MVKNLPNQPIFWVFWVAVGYVLCQISVFDRDEDGFLSLEELRMTIYTLGKPWSMGDIKKKLPKYAKSVDFPEFLALMADDLMDEEESESDTIRGMFDFYDEDDKGYIQGKNLTYEIYY